MALLSPLPVPFFLNRWTLNYNHLFSDHFSYQTALKRGLMTGVMMISVVWQPQHIYNVHSVL